ncbi:ABC transporter transmembrane region [Devosia enhydra]|uniref:ABC transporter transmembrane region n=1 Tax=Devosia enhydra TaxID=665118 RepID=A0A1K2I0M3_9HYPH|nr:ABC transporter ATP-binding protein [Devosia enhydra]SFZ85941.1 ABC transporter transmembrane region [Devosia enhydra]
MAVSEIARTPATSATRPATPAREGLIDALRRLFRHLSARRRTQLALLFGLMLVGAVAELVTIGAVLPFLALIADPGRTADIPLIGPWLTRMGWQGEGLLVPVAIVFAMVALAAGGIRLLLAWASQKFVYRLGHDLGVEVYRRTLYQPYAYHIARNSSALIADINKVQLVVGGILLPLMHAVTSAIIALFILMGLIAIDPFVALVAGAGFGALYLGISIVSRRWLRANGKVIAAAQSQRIQTVQEGLGGIRDVLLDQAQPVYVQKFSAVDTAFRDAQTANAFLGAAPRYVIEATGMVLIAGLAVILTQGEGGFAAALPVLGALALGAVRMLPLLQLIYNGWTQVMGNYHNLADVLTVLEQPMPALSAQGEARPAPLPFVREIVLDGVGFAYAPDAPKVLDGLSLTIPRGARVGIVGKTGSGKSTLMDLLMGLLEPTSGQIRVDDIPLDRNTMGRWQARIAHVPQAIYLSDSSIAENIAFGVPLAEIDRPRLREAARKAAIAEFIEALPQGYETFVGERGVRLSGGQRQRIGIARALYRKADVLVFDEATSALDTETEAAVMKAIERFDDELTILIIAHRASTLYFCNNVVSFEKI